MKTIPNLLYTFAVVASVIAVDKKAGKNQQLQAERPGYGERINERLMIWAPSESFTRIQPGGSINAELFLKWLENFVKFSRPSEEKPVLLTLKREHATVNRQLLTYETNRYEPSPSYDINYGYSPRPYAGRLRLPGNRQKGYSRRLYPRKYFERQRYPREDYEIRLYPRKDYERRLYPREDYDRRLYGRRGCARRLYPRREYRNRQYRQRRYPERKHRRRLYGRHYRDIVRGRRNYAAQRYPLRYARYRGRPGPLPLKPN